MAVLSVDLAYKSYADIGAVVLRQHRDHVCGELVTIPLRGIPQASDLAAYLNQYCVNAGIRVLLLDGPQAWKADDSALLHSRKCERELNTPAKTGLPNTVKPANYLAFVAFSIQVFDSLCAAGWERLLSVPAEIKPSTRVVIESFPLSAWRALNIKGLPAKKKTKPQDLGSRLRALNSVVPLHLSGEPTHDELQALVSGLAGLAIENNDWAVCAASGTAAFISGTTWREGFIVNATGWNSRNAV